MKQFEYIRPQSREEACASLHRYGSDGCILAGGTDLLIELSKQSVKTPKVLVDISFLDDLRGIHSDNGSIGLRPLVTHTELLQSSILHRCAPLLAIAASAIGSPQIRNRGTVGGNIMNAAACADTVPPLVALGAKITLRSARGERQIELADLFLEPYKTNALPDELLTGIQFPKLGPGVRSAFIKLGRRNALSISRLSVAAILQQERDGKIVDARIVPGATFPTWRRVCEGEKMLLGEKPSKELFSAAGQKVSELMIKETGRRWSTEYKEPVIAVLVQRALENCCTLENRNCVTK